MRQEEGQPGVSVKAGSRARETRRHPAPAGGGFVLRATPLSLDAQALPLRDCPRARAAQGRRRASHCWRLSMSITHTTLPKRTNKKTEHKKPERAQRYHWGCRDHR